jgi:hypothetical protein
MPSTTVILERRRIPATVVIPAQAGIRASCSGALLFQFGRVPAFAGMTKHMREGIDLGIAAFA